jgi:exonuclease V gamma subunit
MEETPKLIGLDYGTASQEVLEVLLQDTSEPAVFEEVAAANLHRPEILRLILENPDTPESVRAYVEERMSLPAKASLGMVKAEKAREAMEKRGESLTSKIQRLTISARIQLALKGGREIRGILARDANKEVMLSVLENGKISESEIETIARSRQTLEEALRRIAKNREWMRKYAIVLALVTNPKTPAGIAVSYVSDLKTKDLVILERNKNLAEAVRSAAKKLLHARKPK